MCRAKYMLIYFFLISCNNLERSSFDNNKNDNINFNNNKIELCNGYFYSLLNQTEDSITITIEKEDFKTGRINIVKNINDLVIDDIQPFNKLTPKIKSYYYFNSYVNLDSYIDSLNLYNLNSYVPYIDTNPCYKRIEPIGKAYKNQHLKKVIDSIWVYQDDKLEFSHHQVTLFERDKDFTLIKKYGNLICSYKNPAFCEVKDTFALIKVRTKENSITINGFDNNVNRKWIDEEY